MEGVRQAFRNIRRRKARSALTIFGVMIGVFALTTMGALATSLNQSIQSSLDYVSSRILVTSASGAYGGLFAIGPQVPASLADRAKLVEGVERAYPTITLSADTGEGFSPASSPAMVYGAKPSETAQDPYKLSVSTGRDLTDTDHGKVVLGSTAATKKNAKVGDTVEVLGQKFEVVGILNYLNSDPDNYYITTLEDAQQLLSGQNQFGAAPDLVTNITVIPKPNVDTTALADTLESRFGGTTATPPDQVRKQIEDASQVLNLIVLGSAMIALLVGSLSVINTMLVSVGERRKEIAIKRVVGARARHLLGETVVEAGLIGLIGGLIGFGAGALLVTFINGAASSSGSGFHLTLTKELAFGSIGFAVVLGIVAGLYPAWRAIRIKPVNVLREE
jgi:putative ABC transport system permease protein